MELHEIKERMHHRQLYYPDDPELMKEQLAQLDLQYAYNQLLPSKLKEREALLHNMFASIGEGCYIEAPLHANWGGKNVHLGNHVYANFNLTLIDDTTIHIGDHVMIGPNVVICTGTHPISPSLRMKQTQYNKPVIIKQNVWIGANSIIMPGVTIGENTVIGAGSIVTKDLPANVIAYGNPCSIFREITEADEQYYDKTSVIDIL